MGKDITKFLDGLEELQISLHEGSDAAVSCLL